MAWNLQQDAGVWAPCCMLDRQPCLPGAEAEARAAFQSRTLLDSLPGGSQHSAGSMAAYRVSMKPQLGSLLACTYPSLTARLLACLR